MDNLPYYYWPSNRSPDSTTVVLCTQVCNNSYITLLTIQMIAKRNVHRIWIGMENYQWLGPRPQCMVTRCSVFYWQAYHIRVLHLHSECSHGLQWPGVCSGTAPPRHRYTRYHQSRWELLLETQSRPQASASLQRTRAGDRLPKVQSNL